MVEYAVLLAEMGLGTMQSFMYSAELWLSRVNWEVAGYVGLALIALWIGSWAFKGR